MTKFVPLAVIAIAAVTITTRAHAQAAVQEPGMAAFHQSVRIAPRVQPARYQDVAPRFQAVRFVDHVDGPFTSIHLE
jgi:hypothetical protein